MRRLFVTALLSWMAALPSSGFAADGNLADVVNRKVLRVCSIPQNMPYSNRRDHRFRDEGSD
jgi:hypothetical protein